MIAEICRQVNNRGEEARAEASVSRATANVTERVKKQTRGTASYHRALKNLEAVFADAVFLMGALLRDKPINIFR